MYDNDLLYRYDLSLLTQSRKISKIKLFQNSNIIAKALTKFLNN